MFLPWVCVLYNCSALSVLFVPHPHPVSMSNVSHLSGSACSLLTVSQPVVAFTQNHNWNWDSGEFSEVILPVSSYIHKSLFCVSWQLHLMKLKVETLVCFFWQIWPVVFGLCLMQLLDMLQVNKRRIIDSNSCTDTLYSRFNYGLVQ